MSTVGLVDVILTRLKQEDIVVEGVSPNFLTRYWPPALPEWSTKSVRDAFYASPRFPRLLKPDAVKETISRGLDAGTVAYVGKGKDGGYEPFVYKRSLPSAEVEIADDVYLIAKEGAEEYLAKKSVPVPGGEKPTTTDSPTSTAPQDVPRDAQPDQPEAFSHPPANLEVAGFRWSGEVSPQKWMNFYTKVLSRFATLGGMKLIVTAEVAPPGGINTLKLEETRVALRELGLSEAIEVANRASTRE
jgi:hypothetical protein